MPCQQCGESLDRAAPEPHQCDPERRADYQMFRLRGEVARFDEKWEQYLDRAHGRFEVWLAARRVRGWR